MDRYGLPSSPVLRGGEGRGEVWGLCRTGYRVQALEILGGLRFQYFTLKPSERAFVSTLIQPIGPLRMAAVPSPRAFQFGFRV